MVSDHAILLLEVSLDIELVKSKRWRFDSRLLKDDKFISYLKSEFRIFLSINSPNNPSLLWETAKAYIGGIIIAHSASRKTKQLEQQLKLEKELTDIKSALSLTSDRLLLLVSKQRLYEYRDQPSKYLSHLTKTKRDPQVIPSVSDGNGTRHFDNKNINNTFRQVYARLYESDQPQGVSDRMESFLGKLTLPTISDSQKQELDAPVSREEALLALKSLQSGFFVVNCSGYRPVALLNKDIKLLSKILAFRLEKVLPSLIREDQTGFIKGRSSSFNVRRLLHIINICQTQELTA